MANKTLFYDYITKEEYLQTPEGELPQNPEAEPDPEAEPAPEGTPRGKRKTQ